MILYEFPHSHFCEIARWALEYKRIPYRSCPLFPGYHLLRMRRIAPASHLPVLDTGDRIIQGAAAIVDYLDQQQPEQRLTPDLPVAEITALEAGFAQDIGVPLRRLCYAYLLSEPALVRYFFMHRSPWWQRTLFTLVYPALRTRLRDAYDCTPAGAESAQAELTAALERYDRMLAGREFFAGDGFSRLDLSFAALLAFMVMPPAYPVEWPAALADHTLSEWFATFAGRPAYEHVRRIYATHRASSNTAPAV